MNTLLVVGIVMYDCGHFLCNGCFLTMKNISVSNGVSRPACPACRKKWPNIIPGFAFVNILQVVAQQEVTLVAVRDEAAAELAAVRAEAAKELAAVKDQLGAVTHTLGAVTHKLATVEANVVYDKKLAAAKVETEGMRLAGKNEKKERAASKKAAGTKEQDELEKQMLKEDRERDAPFEAKKLKREEDQDKDWNPKGRR